MVYKKDEKISSFLCFVIKPIYGKHLNVFFFWHFLFFAIFAIFGLCLNTEARLIFS
jgi:hypothetical protein